MAKEIKDRLNTTVPRRVKRRIKDIAEDKGITVNDIVVSALKDYIDRVDMAHSAPDIVLDRMSQILVTQINQAKMLQDIQNTLQNIEEGLE